MRYVNARDVLPEALVQEIRRHCPEGLLYIPAQDGGRRRWGTRTGSSRMYVERNKEIRRGYAQGIGIDELSADFHLSEETIRKIVRGAREEAARSAAVHEGSGRDPDGLARWGGRG